MSFFISINYFTMLGTGRINRVLSFSSQDFDKYLKCDDKYETYS